MWGMPAPRRAAPCDPACSPSCAPPLARRPLPPAAARTLAARLKALAHPVRLHLLARIAAHPGQEACVCTLVPASGRRQPTVTYHLQALHRAGFLAREKRGIWVWYRRVPGVLDALVHAVR